MSSNPESKNTRSTSKQQEKPRLQSPLHDKKLKLATRCPVNPRYKVCNVN